MDFPHQEIIDLAWEAMSPAGLKRAIVVLFNRTFIVNEREHLVGVRVFFDKALAIFLPTEAFLARFKHEGYEEIARAWLADPRRARYENPVETCEPGDSFTLKGVTMPDAWRPVFAIQTAA